MAAVNEVLSKQLHVTPLQKNQVAIYKLIDSEKDDPAMTDLEGKPRKRTPGYTICGKKKIYDAVAGKTVEIENASTKQVIRTPFGEITKTRPEPIRFTSQKPAITVRHDEPEKYAFMERIYENADNPFRVGAKVKPVFYRVDPRKRVMKDNEIREFKLEAMNWVYKEADYTALKACAAKVKQMRQDLNIRVDYSDADASLGFEMLKRELGAVAETDPMTLVKGSSKTELVMKLQIKDCKRFYVIMFEENTRTWFHNDTATSKICVVEAMKNPEEELLKFFATDKDGGKHYTKMVETLKAFLTPR